MFFSNAAFKTFYKRNRFMQLWFSTKTYQLLENRVKHFEQWYKHEWGQFLQMMIKHKLNIFQAFPTSDTSSTFWLLRRRLTPLLFCRRCTSLMILCCSWTRRKRSISCRWAARVASSSWVSSITSLMFRRIFFLSDFVSNSDGPSDPSSFFCFFFPVSTSSSTSSFRDLLETSRLSSSPDRDSDFSSSSSSSSFILPRRSASDTSCPSIGAPIYYKNINFFSVIKMWFK